MKNLKGIFGLAVMALFIFSACHKNELAEENLAFNNLTEMDYQPQTIEELDDSYLAEEDLVLLKNVADYEENVDVEKHAYAVTASGPTYMPGGTNFLTWNYTGNIPNVQSITWWYKKVNSNEAPYVIGYGNNGHFLAVSDTFYSNNSHKTSKFELYLKVRDTSGNIFTSSTYKILKKGKYKLQSAF